MFASVNQLKTSSSNPTPQSRHRNYARLLSRATIKNTNERSATSLRTRFTKAVRQLLCCHASDAGDEETSSIHTYSSVRRVSTDNSRRDTLHGWELIACEPRR